MSAIADSLPLSRGYVSPDPNIVEVLGDVSQQTYWCYLKPNAPRVFTRELLAVLGNLQREFSMQPRAVPAVGVDMQYRILGSRIPGVFNLGGDLNLVLELVGRRDREALHEYGRACVELIHTTATAGGRMPTTSIAVVEGQALGGGLEAALACDVLIAERGCKMGFPEVLFNMFPGMGAYPLLTRRVGAGVAARIIRSGKTYVAQELHELGVVDVLVDKGEGVSAASNYISRHRRRARGLHAFARSIEVETPLVRENLFETLDIWVDCAMDLSRSDKRLMAAFAKAQDNLVRYAV